MSAADMQWPEVYASILQSQGHHVEFDPPDWDGQWDLIFINGIPLDSEFYLIYLTISYIVSFHSVFDD